MCFKKKAAIPISSYESIYETERHCTDVTFLLLKAIFLIGLFVLIALCFPRSDIYRVINGYDDCGNVCGRENVQNSELLCSGKNMISKKYLLLIVIDSVTEPARRCVPDCDADGGYKLFFNRCIRFDPLLRERAPQGFLDELWQDVELFRLSILLLCLLGFFSSLLVLALLWYIPRILIWTLVFGTIVVCVAGTGWFWIQWHLESGASRWLYFALGSSLVCILLGVFLAAVWKKVTLMVQLLHESGLALKSMVFLVFLPVLTILIMTAMLGTSLYLGLLIESCGSAAMVGSSVHYVKDSLAVLARWYNFMALIWFYHFLLGCQHAVTAGAITQWYFTRQDDRLQNVQSRSFTMLVRYHLGTVALGSFLLAVLLLFQWMLKIMRLITRKSRSNRRKCCCLYCCQCCVGCLQSLLDPITRKAFIFSALYGHSFFTAGKRVAKMYAENSGQMFAVDAIGSIIFILAQLSVLVLVGFTGVRLVQNHAELYHPYVLLAIVLMIVYLITHCCMLMYKISIDGVYLCFCIDTEMNNGVERPYFMSEQLQQFIQGTAKSIQPARLGTRSNPQQEQ